MTTCVVTTCDATATATAVIAVGGGLTIAVDVCSDCLDLL